MFEEMDLEISKRPVENANLGQMMRHRRIYMKERRDVPLPKEAVGNLRVPVEAIHSRWLQNHPELTKDGRQVNFNAWVNAPTEQPEEDDLYVEIPAPETHGEHGREEDIPIDPILLGTEGDGLVVVTQTPAAGAQTDPLENRTENVAFDDSDTREPDGDERGGAGEEVKQRRRGRGGRGSGGGKRGRNRGGRRKGEETVAAQDIAKPDDSGPVKKKTRRGK